MRARVSGDERQARRAAAAAATTPSVVVAPVAARRASMGVQATPAALTRIREDRLARKPHPSAIRSLVPSLDRVPQGAPLRDFPSDGTSVDVEMVGGAMLPGVRAASG